MTGPIHPEAEGPALDAAGPLHEQVFRRLRADLMAGRFAPGQKLPLRALAQQMGTSLMPVRDAVQRLESLGVLRLTPGRTMIVPELSPDERADLVRLRLVLETETAAVAALRRTEAELAALGGECALMRRAAAAGDTPAFLAANLRFHGAIAAAAHNRFLAEVLDPLWMRLGPIVRVQTPDQANMLRSAVYHDDILLALLRRDGAAAAAAMRRDILDEAPAGVAADALPGA